MAKKTKNKVIKIPYESEEDFDRYDQPKTKYARVPKYLYHSSSAENHQSIVKHGLKTHSETGFGAGSSDLYFATDKDYDHAGSMDSIRKHPVGSVTYRVPSNILKAKDIGIDEDMGGGIDNVAGGSWQVSKNIKPKHIHARIGNKWVSLLKLQEKAKRSTSNGYMLTHNK